MNGIAAQSISRASPDTKYPASSVLSDAYSFYRIIFSCQAIHRVVGVYWSAAEADLDSVSNGKLCWRRGKFLGV